MMIMFLGIKIYEWFLNFAVFFIVMASLMNSMGKLRIFYIIGSIFLITYSIIEYNLFILIISTVLCILNILIFIRIKRTEEKINNKNGDVYSFEWLIPHMKKEIIKEGTIIFNKGDKADKMYYIKKGALKVKEINKIVEEGNVIGEMGIFSPAKKRTASAECVRELEVYTITHKDIVKLYYKSPILVFKIMQLTTKRFIDNSTDMIKSKEKMESELKIAKTIQANMLPCSFPAFPDRKDFEIFATMEPAKDIGGDLYDFFLINENKLCILVGDVSGKGVPAALFMMITKVLLKHEGMQESKPCQVLSRVNNMIVEENPECLFVTVFLAMIDLETGEMEYASAGHNPPLIYKKEEDQFNYLEMNKSFVLGAFSGYRYKTEKLKMEKGDMIFVYSDGITEAMNPEDKLYSEERLKNELNNIKHNSVTDIVTNIRESVRDYAQEAPQSDDITMLCFKYNGK